MIHSKKFTCALLIIVIGWAELNAQEAIPSTGGNVAGAGGTVSYSVGQIVYTTNTGSNGSVAQGVQQPYEISVVTTTEAARYLKLSVSAYPNPATDILTLSIENAEISGLSFEFYDMSGKLLESKNIENLQTNINISDLEPATYFLKVKQENKEVKTFKITKN